jgi:hypothetical protein
MAQFRALIQGQRGEASRLGSKKSGISTHTNGWGCGVTVYGYVDNDGEDKFRVTLTSGSGYRGVTKHLGTFSAKDLNNVD